MGPIFHFGVSGLIGMVAGSRAAALLCRDGGVIRRDGDKFWFCAFLLCRDGGMMGRDGGIALVLRHDIASASCFRWSMVPLAVKFFGDVMFLRHSQDDGKACRQRIHLEVVRQDGGPSVRMAARH